MPIFNDAESVAREITILDGPVGTELERRGVVPDPRCWSAAAIDTAPETIAAIHHDYAAAGATVHTANTFRTTHPYVGRRWQAMTDRAVRLARDAVPPSHRVFGSLAPRADCYRPDQTPADTRDHHQQTARWLAECGCDGLICETFANAQEAVTVTKAATGTGLPVWVSLTAGPGGDLMTADEMAMTAREVIEHGAAAVLVNCVAASATLAMVQVLVTTLAKGGYQVPVGAYANAGHRDEGIGWHAADQNDAPEYARRARDWITAGACIVGGCCGTGPEHIAAIHAALGPPAGR